MTSARRATCHCGAVELALDMPQGPAGIVDPRRCDCSMCRRRGTVMASVPLARLRVVRGEDALRLYQFGTMTARHWFCGTCGTNTHHQRRSNPNEYGVNLGCIEGVDIRDYQDVPLLDGMSHPADR